MNKVIIENNDIMKYMPDDLFTLSGQVYVLSVIGHSYYLMSIVNGCTWNGSHDTIEQAIKGATFIGRNLTITISK